MTLLLVLLKRPRSNLYHHEQMFQKIPPLHLWCDKRVRSSQYHQVTFSCYMFLLSAKNFSIIMQKTSRVKPRVIKCLQFEVKALTLFSLIKKKSCGNYPVRSSSYSVWCWWQMQHVLEIVDSQLMIIKNIFNNSVQVLDHHVLPHH